jgi:hypothetical protein
MGDCFLYVICTTGTIDDGSKTDWLNIRNETNTTIRVAMKYLDEPVCGRDGWLVGGWLTLRPGAVVPVVPLADGHNSHFYIYATGADGTVYEGSSWTYVTSVDFARCKASGTDSNPGWNSAYLVGMLEFLVDSSATTYTLSLVPLDDSDCPFARPPGINCRQS